MLELVHPVEKTSSKTDKNKKISLVQMVKEDPELRDFFKLIYQEDLRDKALKGIQEKIAFAKGKK